LGSIKRKKVRAPLFHGRLRESVSSRNKYHTSGLRLGRFPQQ
jgi:hypothetical protein